MDGRRFRFAEVCRLLTVDEPRTNNRCHGSRRYIWDHDIDVRMIGQAQGRDEADRPVNHDSFLRRNAHRVPRDC